MADITFEEILQAVQKLSPHQKAVLAQSLEPSSPDRGPTRETLLAELEALRAAGAFSHLESLRNRYTKPTLDSLTDAQLAADIRETAAKWEQALDKFFENKD